MIQKLRPFSLIVNRQVHKLSTDDSQTVHGRTNKSIIRHFSAIDLEIVDFSAGRAMQNSWKGVLCSFSK